MELDTTVIQKRAILHQLHGLVVVCQNEVIAVQVIERDHFMVAARKDGLFDGAAGRGHANRADDLVGRLAVFALFDPLPGQCLRAANRWALVAAVFSSALADTTEASRTAENIVQTAENFMAILLLKGDLRPRTRGHSAI